MLKIQVFYKEEGKLFDHFRDNWKRETYVSSDDDGFEVEFTEGIRESVTDVPVVAIPIEKGGEKVQIISKFGNPIFTLEGPKAFQTTVLETQLAGLLKIHRA